MQEQDLYDATVISVPRNFTTFNYKLVNQLSDYWTCLRSPLFNPIQPIHIIIYGAIEFCKLIVFPVIALKIPNTSKNELFVCICMAVDGFLLFEIILGQGKAFA